MKILIVEDELFIRKGIVNSINWNEIGFEAPIEAGNGVEALDKIVQQHPDVILLDIRLPKMNGLELLNEIKNKAIELEVIILSGHDEFEYAQKAMELGVKQYLLKPVSTDEIKKALSNVREQIINKRQKKQQIERLKQQINQNLPLLKAIYINSLLNGTAHDIDNLKSQGEYLDIRFCGEYFSVLVCIIDHDEWSFKTFSEESKNIDRYLVTNILLEVLEQMKLNFERDGQSIVHTPNQDEAVVIISQKQKNKVQALKSIVARKINEALKDQDGFSLTIGIGNTYQGLNNIKYSYQEAKNATVYKFIKGRNQIIDIKDVEPDSNISFFLPNDLQKNLISSIKQGNYEQSKQILDKFFELILNNSKMHTVNNIKVTCWELLSNVLKVVTEIGGDISDIINNVDEVYIRFEKFYTIKEYRQYIENVTRKIIDYVINKRYQKYRTVIRKINQYIEQNFKYEDLNLDAISSYVNMNPNYLSYIYKKETGESLTNYIRKVRIEKAKELLEKTNKKIYDIAYEVGFRDAHYFTICFKNITGVTPSEYRQSLNI